MIAIGLIKGDLIAEDYEDDTASDPRIDSLREKMVVEENKRYSSEYLEADKRSIANSLQVFFKDGSSTNAVEVEYPIGHKRRREEGIPILISKFERNLQTQLSSYQTSKIIKITSDQAKLEKLSVIEFMSLFVKK
tara:strand:- start:671 stop:1075 length:405 start_codon:yes stop_codon:yes gene_type:complete